MPSFIEDLIKRSQKVNRDNWLDATYKKLSQQMQDIADTGLRYIVLDLNEIIRGSENLMEAAEMLQLISKTLTDNGLTVTMSPEGDCYVAW